MLTQYLVSNMQDEAMLLSTLSKAASKMDFKTYFAGILINDHSRSNSQRTSLSLEGA